MVSAAQGTALGEWPAPGIAVNLELVVSVTESEKESYIVPVVGYVPVSGVGTVAVSDTVSEVA